MNSDDEDSLGSDTDYAVNDDMEAFKRACLLAGTDPSNLQIVPSGNCSDTGASTSQGDSDNSDDEDDFQIVRDLKKRFDLLNDETEEETFAYKPIRSILSVSSKNCKDDFETLRAIQHRFSAYDDDRNKESLEKARCKPEQVGVTNIDSEKETSSNCFLESSNAWEGFPNCVDKSSSSTQRLEACNMTVAGSLPSEFVGWQKTDADDATIGPVKGSNFPKSAQAFVDAIKKNRSCQQLIRSKLMHIEAKIEEIKLLKGRVKVLKDFQIQCKTRTGKALSQKKDARVQLISAMKPTHSKGNGKSSAMHYGPAENPQVASYRDAKKKFPVFINRGRWSDKEKENLAKGVRQQIQLKLLEGSVDQVSSADGSLEEHVNVDSFYSSISELDITPEIMRAFLPKVNWNDLASMYYSSRSGAECQSRWLNCEDPLINHGPWSTEEDRNLLRVVKQKGLSGWIDIAVSLGTNRTPFQCLARYQRSLNASSLKGGWTPEEDDQLRAAVEAFGESNWQTVASSLGGRTGTQCSNRWIKTLHPTRKKVGTWTSEEDERLKVAVMLFGPKTWRKVADFIPGRTHVQCRERWVNNLDPSLNFNKWTEEEDLRLEEAIQEHGYSWSKVATCFSARTDNQCLRRWKVLFPQEVPLLKDFKNLERAALVSNFVDREAFRSSLAPTDFVPLSKTTGISQSDDLCIEEVPSLTYGEVGNSIGRKKRKGVLRKLRDIRNSVWLSNDKELKISGGRPVTEVANCHKRASKLQPRRRKCLAKRKNGDVENRECSSSIDDPSFLMDTEGWDADDGVRNGEAANGFQKPQVETNFAGKPAPKKRKQAIDLKRKRKSVTPDVELPDVEDKELCGDGIWGMKSKRNTRQPRSKRIPQASGLELKLANKGNAKLSGKRHRNCLSPSRSSASDIEENGKSKASYSPERKKRSQEFLKRIMEEDDLDEDNTTLASFIHHVKFQKRMKAEVK